MPSRRAITESSEGAAKPDQEGLRTRESERRGVKAARELEAVAAASGQGSVDQGTRKSTKRNQGSSDGEDVWNRQAQGGVAYKDVHLFSGDSSRSDRDESGYTSMSIKIQKKIVGTKS